ncbi:hypothetical protein [Nocardia sp. AG03]|uniref:hypothetical protein n=1 Tax=Nocardia sp. AG03 TaxID=3025312 RepID=UPI00241899E5|nr:hypothetical protein [Nocardia sp. AG03]
MIVINLDLITRMAQGSRASDQVRRLAEDLAIGAIEWRQLQNCEIELPPELTRLLEIGAGFDVVEEIEAAGQHISAATTAPEQRRHHRNDWAHPIDIDDEDEMPDTWLE